MHFPWTKVALIFALTLSICARVDAQSDLVQFEAYACQYKTADEVSRLLRPMLPDSPHVQLVVDHKQNRILLSGADDVQAIAKRVLREVDQPIQRLLPGSLPPNHTPTMRLYQVVPERQQEFLDRLRQMFGQAGLHMTADQKNGRVAVTAVPDVHQAIENFMRTAGSSAAPARQPLPKAARQLAGNDRSGRLVVVHPERLSRLQQQLSGIFGHGLSVGWSDGREVLQLSLRQPSPQHLVIEFDRRRGEVLLGGPVVPVGQLVTLIEALASDSRTAGVRTHVFRVQRENHRSLKEIVELTPQQSQPALASWNVHTRDAGPSPAGGPVAPVRYLHQEEDSKATQPAVPPANVADGTAPLREELPQFEGVEIESLPELDVIILRGRDQDLQRLEAIIRQLERVSQETQPEVRIYHLRHAQSEAVAALVTQVGSDLVSGRAGQVNVTPLVKPNALLLIGWGEAVNAMVELIEQLDSPVASQTQSFVFHLRHASANAVQKTLQTFFADRDGLGPVVQITVDARTNSLVVYAAPRDMQEVNRIVEQLDRPGSATVNQARIFQIENALAADVAKTLQQAIQSAAENEDRSAILELQTFDAEGQRILRSGNLDDVQITPNPRNNTIIVSCPRENVELIEELIRQLDSPAVQAQIKVFRILNGDAVSLVETLRSLLPSQLGNIVGPQLSSSSGESSLAPLRFSVDVRSNSIIATGSEGDLRIVEALLVKLDQSTSLQRKTAVFQLKNTPAIDVANAVNQFLISRRQVEEAAPGADNPFQEIEAEVVVVPEPVANKLILAATPRYFEEVEALIEKLDEEPPQVMIQVLIAEVALNDADEFGVELGLQDSVLFDRSLLGDLITTTNSTQVPSGNTVVTAIQEVIQSASNVPGFAFNSVGPLGNSGSDASIETADNVGAQGLSNFAVGRGNEQLGFGGLVLSASNQNISVLIRALQETRRVEILSRPQIRTLDNQPAFIQVGQRVPRIIGSTVNENGQSNSVTLENVGLILGVTPRISPDGMVVMEIDSEKSRVGPEVEGIPVAVSVDGTVIRSPRVDTATAQTTVSAMDGETIVLGGLITQDKQEIHRQVPLLGDLPILKHLFRYDGYVSRRSELLIILTPHIIRTPEDNERIRQIEISRMSWCAADVFALQGDIGFENDMHLQMLENGQPDIIFPDLNPSGQKETIPQNNSEPAQDFTN